MWSLAAVETPDGMVRTVALTADGQIAPIEVLPPTTGPLEILRDWARFAPILRQWTPAKAAPLETGRLRAPLRFPPKVICAGANYRDHRREMKTADAPVEPFFFLKPPSTTVIGPGDEIIISDRSDQVDWEAEIAVVIGRGGRFIQPEAAMQHVAGYTLLNDVSARAALQRPNAISPAFAFDWLASKGQDTFCPIGPGITPSWFLPDPAAIKFDLSVNGVTKQSASTSELVTDIPHLIAAASSLMALEPGDLIATGTPGGVGMAKGEFLDDGDVVVLNAAGIGTLSNRVRLQQSKRADAVRTAA